MQELDGASDNIESRETVETTTPSLIVSHYFSTETEKRYLPRKLCDNMASVSRNMSISPPPSPSMFALDSLTLFPTSSSPSSSPVAPAKKKRKNLDKGGDISADGKTVLWTHLYKLGTYPRGRDPVCIVCQLNTIGLEVLNKADFAHVAPRGGGGNNTETWNRVPLCRDCNSGCASRNLLDYIVDNYRHRLIPVVAFLYEVYKKRDLLRAYRFQPPESTVPDYSEFVLSVYGSDCNDLPEEGRFRSPLVCQILKRHFEAQNKLRRLQASISDIESDQMLLKRHVLDVCAKVIDKVGNNIADKEKITDATREMLMRVLTRERERLDEQYRLRDLLQEQIDQSARWK